MWQANKTPNEIPLRLTPRAFACSKKSLPPLFLDPQKFDCGYASAQDDTPTVMRRLFFAAGGETPPLQGIFMF